LTSSGTRVGSGPRSVLVSCGEPSGDLYAGALIRELRGLLPDLSVAGLGGPQFAAAGGRLIDDYRGLAATGLTEVLATLPKSAATLRRLVAYAREQRPDALIIIDFPEINLRLARAVRKLGIPVIYYIAPQIWAWRRGGRQKNSEVVVWVRSTARVECQSNSSGIHSSIWSARRSPVTPS
jgi:lipid-A-disaccharide synthase